VQLANLRPDLRFTGLRGNVNTRLAKRGEFDAIVMAQAAIDRLALDVGEHEVLDAYVIVPQVGQGALAVECRAEDEVTRSLLSGIEHPATRWAVDAERAFLAELGGDCALPAGAHAVIVDDALHLTDAGRATGARDGLPRRASMPRLGPYVAGGCHQLGGDIAYAEPMGVLTVRSWWRARESSPRRRAGRARCECRCGHRDEPPLDGTVLNARCHGLSGSSSPRPTARRRIGRGACR
jgi:hypothetical protein